MAWEKEENEDVKYIVSGVVALAAFGLDRILLYFDKYSSDGWYSPLHMWGIGVSWGRIVSVDVDTVGWVVVALAIAAILQGVGCLIKQEKSTSKRYRMIAFCIVVVIIGVFGIVFGRRFYASFRRIEASDVMKDYEDYFFPKQKRPETKKAWPKKACTKKACTTSIPWSNKVTERQIISWSEAAK